jgi:hypothetical protein
MHSVFFKKTGVTVKGTYTELQPKSHFHCHMGSGETAIVNTAGRWPKLPFPKFDGDNPKLWQSRSKNYFVMSGVDRSNWVCISSMYFEGLVARWLQSVEARANVVGWEDFCRMVHDRFGRDQHEILI